MSGVCDPFQNIGTYASSNSSSVNTKNVDVVTLTATTITTDHLTINGDPIEIDIADAITKTQNQTSGSDDTTFAGTIVPDKIVVSSSFEAPTLTAPVLKSSTGTLTSTADIDCNTFSISPNALIISNPSTTTLGYNLLSTYSPVTSTPSTTTWNLGVTANTNTCAAIVFNNIGLGSTSNYMKIGPKSSSGLLYYTDRIRVEGMFLVNSQGISQKVQPATATTIVPGTLLYPTDFSTVINRKRIVIHGIDVIVGGSGTPQIQVGYNNNYVTASGSAVYNGTTGGNNGAAQIIWADTGIYLWGAATMVTGYKMTFTVEFTYINSGTGIADMMSVNGGSCITDHATMYHEFLAGHVLMPLATYPNFTCVRLSFPQAPVSGYVNCLVF